MNNRRFRPVLRTLGPGVLLGAIMVVALSTVVAAQTGPVPVQIPRPLTPPVAPADLTQGTWQWVRTEYGDGSVVEAGNPIRYTIAFRPDGTLSIRADCNQVVGTYTRQGASLTLRLGATTLAACPPDSQADVFVRDLSAVAAYVFSGDHLVLNMRLDTGNMIFEQQPVASLTDTAWHVQSYNNGQGGVVTTLPQTQLTAQFGPDQRVVGSAGCNRFTGTFALDGESVSFGPLATTRMACPEPIMDQERAFLAALEATTQFTQTGDRLTLRNADGAIQAILVSATT
jgi:heat shock protein HslJ